MTVQQLIEHLQTFPPDLPVAFEDMNFGGLHEEAETENFRTSDYHPGYLWIDAPSQTPLED